MDEIVVTLQKTLLLADEFHMPITLFILGFYGLLLVVEKLVPAQSDQRIAGKIRNVGFGLIKYVLVDKKKGTG